MRTGVTNLYQKAAAKLPQSKTLSAFCGSTTQPRQFLEAAAETHKPGAGGCEAVGSIWHVAGGEKAQGRSVGGTSVCRRADGLVGIRACPDRREGMTIAIRYVTRVTM